MAALPYMQFFVADYLADTAHLTTAEHGAYLLLLFNYWQRGESFKAKNEQLLNKRLASVARMSEQEFAGVSDTLEEFFSVTETEWLHERIERDLSVIAEKSEKKSNAGKASAEARKKKQSSEEAQQGEAEEQPKKQPQPKKENAKNILARYGVDGKVAEDFITHRGRKHPITETAMTGISDEAQKVALSTAEAVKVMIDAGWMGFRADWYMNRIGVKQKNGCAKPAVTPTSEGRYIPPEERESFFSGAPYSDALPGDFKVISGG